MTDVEIFKTVDKMKKEISDIIHSTKRELRDDIHIIDDLLRGSEGENGIVALTNDLKRDVYGDGKENKGLKSEVGGLRKFKNKMIGAIALLTLIVSIIELLKALK